jgi:hypothetical protein
MWRSYKKLFFIVIFLELTKNNSLYVKYDCVSSISGGFSVLGNLFSSPEDPQEITDFLVPYCKGERRRTGGEGSSIFP